MIKRSLVEQLDQAIEAILARRRPTPPRVDATLAPLIAVAADLCRLPRADFKAHLKSKLERKTTMTATAVKPIREGFRTITPYLVLRGAARFAEFAKHAFGAQEVLRVPAPQGKLMHAEVRIGDSMVEFADANEQFPPTPTSLHLYVEDADAMYQRALDAGASSVEEPTDQPYGDREAGVKDVSGNVWYIATHKAAGPEKFIPEGLHSVTPFLHPRGAEEFIVFLKAAFGAEEAGVFKSSDGTIVHAKVRIGDSIIEIGEAHGQFQPMPTTLHLYVEDCDA